MKEIKAACYPNGKSELLSDSFCCHSWDRATDTNDILFDKLILTDVPVFIYNNAALLQCPFCEADISYSYITDLQELVKLLDIGSCDFCGEHNRVILKLEDARGIHILNQCKFGCEDNFSESNWLNLEAHHMKKNKQGCVHVTPQFLIMYEFRGEDKPKFHILFNELSKDAKLLELHENPEAINIQLFETHKVTL